MTAGVLPRHTEGIGLGRAGRERAIDEGARDDFARRHGNPELGAVTVVVPAYREAATIGAVVADLPHQILGLPVSALVVVDGDDDGTAEIATDAGSFVCVAPVNRGQGAALRLGYEIAAVHGTRFIATIDADGQYDPADIARVVAPLVDGTADLVSGSRRLGFHERDDLVRRGGVVVFAWMISLLTRHRLTDPANGLKAMLASVPARLTLDEDQYQSSELLVGAIMRGLRVVEVPVTMRRRRSGSTKKGNNLRYGLEFARVVTKTWFRER